jgi:hypothetical protein
VWTCRCVNSAMWDRADRGPPGRIGDGGVDLGQVGVVGRRRRGRQRPGDRGGRRIEAGRGGGADRPAGGDEAAVVLDQPSQAAPDRGPLGVGRAQAGRRGAQGGRGGGDPVEVGARRVGLPRPGAVPPQTTNAPSGASRARSAASTAAPASVKAGPAWAGPASATAIRAAVRGVMRRHQRGRDIGGAPGQLLDGRVAPSRIHRDRGAIAAQALGPAGVATPLPRAPTGLNAVARRGRVRQTRAHAQSGRPRMRFVPPFRAIRGRIRQTRP